MSEAGVVAAGRREEVLAIKPFEQPRVQFEGWLVFTAIVVTLLCAYESLAQSLVPAASIVSMLHAYGIMEAYPVVYEPGKGIWRLMGWTGSGMMVLMMAYTIRKRLGHKSSLGSMRVWLNFHMLMGIVGPILITFHTTFKFGGLIGTSYWAMIATVLFGVVGRYIYIQIPRGINGAELSMKDIDSIVAAMEKRIESQLEKKGVDQKKILSLLNGVNEASVHDGNGFAVLLSLIANDLKNRFRTWKLKRAIVRQFGLDSWTAEKTIALVKKKAALIRKKNLLSTTHRMLRYWHVVHIPLAIVMFSIMFIHIIVYFIFSPAAGY